MCLYAPTLAGKSLPGKRENVTLKSVSSRRHTWDGTVSGRGDTTPHMKSFFRYTIDDECVFVD